MQWGADQIGHTVGNLRFSWGHEAFKNAAGFVTGLRGWCQVPEAYLYPVGATVALAQADAKARMDTLYALSQNQMRDLKFLNDDGTGTTNVQYAVGAEGGLVTWDTLVWSDAPGAQFITFRQFAASFSWRINLLTSWQRANLLVDWNETITVEGGLPEFVTHRPVNSATPQQHITSTALVWTITQSGYAEGYSHLPAANSPLYGTTPPLKMRSVKEVGGRRVGTDAIVNRRREWNYVFELASATPPTPAVTQWTQPFTGP